jgi:FMN reductase [NAD(P)H]
VEFADVLRKRVMVRSYTDQRVPDDVLGRVLRVVRRVPSAGFSQGQRLVVVTDPKLREEAGDIADARYTDLGFPAWISRAPVHLYLCTRESSYHERYAGSGDAPPDWPVPFWWYDCGALFMLLQLAAINEGLATGFHGAVYKEELTPLARVVDLPDDLALIGLLTLGYPDESISLPVPAGAVSRKPDDEIIAWRR